MKVRVFIFVIGLLFIAVACIAPVRDRKWSRYEPVGLRGKGYQPSTKMTLVYYDDRADQTMVKYTAFLVGGIMVYLSFREYGRPDYKALRRWAYLQKRRRKI